jgi:hypothetical protein
MILDATTKSIQVILGEVKTTNDCDITAAWGDYVGQSFVPGANDTATNGTSAVTLVAAPIAGVQRLCTEITFHNNDTVTHSVSFELLDTATTRIFRYNASVPAGGDFSYVPGSTVAATTSGPGAFTTLSASSTVSGAGFTAYFASPPALGGSAPNTGAFTTLSASSTVSGVGFTSLFSSPSAIGNTAPSSGAFTTLSASSTVSGAGITALFASPPAIGGTAPAAGAFTTLSATSTITPSQTAGIVGTTTNNSANAGSVGEEIESVISSASPVALSTTIVNTITTIALSAGDWDVGGEVWINIGTGGATLMQGAVSAASSVPLNGTGTGRNLLQIAVTASSIQILPLRQARVTLSGSATYFLLASATFPSGTVTAYGNIWARRAR